MIIQRRSYWVALAPSFNVFISDLTPTPPSPPPPLWDHPDCRLCALQLFPCCGSSLCYFVSAWLQPSIHPPLTPPHHLQSNTNPTPAPSPLLASPPRPLPPSAAALRGAGEGAAFCLPRRCPRLLKKKGGGLRRPRLPTVREEGYSSWGPPSSAVLPPPVAGPDPHEATSRSWDPGSPALVEAHGGAGTAARSS